MGCTVKSGLNVYIVFIIFTEYLFKQKYLQYSHMLICDSTKSLVGKHWNEDILHILIHIFITYHVISHKPFNTHIYNTPTNSIYYMLKGTYTHAVHSFSPTNTARMVDLLMQLRKTNRWSSQRSNVNQAGGMFTVKLWACFQERKHEQRDATDSGVFIHVCWVYTAASLRLDEQREEKKGQRGMWRRMSIAIKGFHFFLYFPCLLCLCFN